LHRLYKRLQKSFERDRAVDFKEMRRDEMMTVLDESEIFDSVAIYKTVRKFAQEF